MNRIVIIIFLSFVFNTTAQESDQGTSIFPYNTCIMPCWMGIIPGKSTSLDVDISFAKYDEILTLREYGRTISRLPSGEYAVDETSGVIEQGGYTFDVLTPTNQFKLVGASSRIEIRDSVVDLVMVLATEEYDILLGIVIDHLGSPDYIRMYSNDDFQTTRFTLIYLTDRTIINLYQSDLLCQTDRLFDSFSLLNIFYHSQRSALDHTPSVDPNIIQPRLITYWYENERDVPLDVWKSWLEGDVEESCYKAWQKLEPPDLEAIAITQTPTVEVTAEPTP